MPFYTYECPHCSKRKDFDLPMGHDEPKCKDMGCKEADCPPEDKLSRIYTPIASTWKCGRPTDTTSATREKNAKLRKLYNDSYVGMDNYDKVPLDERKKKEAEEE